MAKKKSRGCFPAIAAVAIVALVVAAILCAGDISEAIHG